MIWGSNTTVVNLKTMVDLLLSLFLCRNGIQLVVQAKRNLLAFRASEEHVSHTQYYTHTNRKLII